MTKLATLRSRLVDLRRKRELVRWATAYAALALALFWTLAGAFLIDWALQMSRVQRFIVLLGTLAIIVWAFIRFVRPWLLVRESEIDVALIVERQQKLDSDLVAAIQFESPAAATWGSGQLQTAVIDYVADFSKSWSILSEVPRQTMVRRATALAITLLVLVIGLAISPGHGLAFINRFFLGSAHYPTRTVIRSILVNNTSIESGQLRMPHGVPLRFKVEAHGQLPAEGNVVVRTIAGHVESSLKLTKGKDQPGVYTGDLSELVDSMSFQLYLGDAWTEPTTIDLIPLPIVETHLTAVVPQYAKIPQAVEATATREISVIEGSRVDLQVSCTNKSLAKATLTIEGRDYQLVNAAQSSTPGRLWTIDSKGTPLEAISKPLRYQIQVTDSDGMKLPQPIEGTLRIKPDQKPRITATAITKQILQNAILPIDYRVVDDYGIKAISVHMEITHADATTDNRPEFPALKIDNAILKNELPLKGTVPLQLADLKLVKGDQIKIVLEATDYRGEIKGQTTASEPLIFGVTDEAGIYEDIAKVDEKAAADLQRVIDKQFEIGHKAQGRKP